MTIRLYKLLTDSLLQNNILVNTVNVYTLVIDYLLVGFKMYNILQLYTHGLEQLRSWAYYY